MPSTAQVSPGDFAWSQGRLGYVLFFALSGFLLYLPWVRSLEGGKAPDIRQYLRRRAARILPAYYVALVASILLLYPIAGTPGLRLPPADSLPLFFVFGQNFTSATALKLDPPMWTLAVEVTYYLALPLLGLLAVALAGARRSRLTVPMALIAAGVAWNALVVALGWPLPATKVLPAMLPYFGVGMLAATVWGTQTLSPGRGRALLLGALGLLLADLVLHSGIFPGAFVRTVLDLPAAAGFALIVAVAGASVIRMRILDSPPVAALGTISYGIYLWNVPVLLILRSKGLLPLDTLAALPIVTAISMALGALSWFAVERPAIAWARGRPRETAQTAR